MRTVEASRRFVKAWCKDKDIIFRESAYTLVPYAVYDPSRNHAAIHVPLLSSLNFEEWCRQVYHEASHLDPNNRWHYKVLTKLADDGHADETHHSVANCLIDNMAERNDYDFYRGRAQILGSARSPFSDKFREKVADEGFQGEADKLITAMIQLDMLDREGWMQLFTAPFGHVDYEETREYRQGIEAMRVFQILPVLMETAETNEAQAVEATAELVKKIVQLLPQQEEEEESQGGGGSGTGEGDEQGEGAASEREGEPEGQEAQTGSGEGNTSTASEVSSGISNAAAEYNPALDRNTGENEAKDNSEVTKFYIRNSGQNFYIPASKTNIVHLHERDEWDERKNSILKQYGWSNLDKKIRKHLQLKAQGSTIHGVKRGKLSSKSLHKLYVNNQVKPPGVFKKHTQGMVKMDSAVTMLIDCSGSMGSTSANEPYIIAAASALSLAEVLRGLRIQYEIIGFTEHYQHDIYIYKSYAERAVALDKLAARLSSGRIRQWYNTDGQSVLFAAERLIKRNERNKVLMVLSDGRPALSGCSDAKGNPSYYLKQVTEDIEKNSPIHLCALGIQSDWVREFYTHHEIVNSIENLGEAVLKTLAGNLMY